MIPMVHPSVRLPADLAAELEPWRARVRVDTTGGLLVAWCTECLSDDAFDEQGFAVALIEHRPDPTGRVYAEPVCVAHVDVVAEWAHRQGYPAWWITVPVETPDRPMTENTLENAA